MKLKTFKIQSKIKSKKVIDFIDNLKSYRQDFNKQSNRELVIELILNSDDYNSQLFDKMSSRFNSLKSEINFYEMFLSDLVIKSKTENLNEIERLIYNIVKKSFEFNESIDESFVKNFTQFIKESVDSDTDELFYIIVKSKELKIYDSDEIIKILNKANLDCDVDVGIGYYEFKSTKEILEKIIKLFNLENFNIKFHKK